MRVRKSLAAAVILSLSLAGLLSATTGPARADDSAIEAEPIVTQFIAHLHTKKIAKAVEMMNPDVIDAVGAKPTEALRLAKAVVERFAFTAKIDRKNAIPVAEIALRAAKKAAGVAAPAGAGDAPAAPSKPAGGGAEKPTKPDEGGDMPDEGGGGDAAAPPSAPIQSSPDDGPRALAFARLGLAATRMTVGEPVEPVEWTESLAEMRKLSATSPTGAEDLKLCVDTIWFATDDDAPLEPPLRAAAETADFAAKTFPNAEGLKSLAVQAKLALVCGLAWTKPDEAKKTLPGALQAVAALGEEADKDKVLVSLWNRAVAEGRRIKVPAFKFAFKVDKVQTGNSYFEMSMPRESGWETQQGNDQVQLIIERDRGVKGKTSISIWMYKWDTNYIDDEDKRVGGENRSGMMKRHRLDNMKTMSKITKDQKSVATKFSSNFPDVMGCEFRGKDADGNDARNRIWAFYGEWHKQTYLIDVMQTGAVKEVDAQLEFVLDSLTELGKKK